MNDLFTEYDLGIVFHKLKKNLTEICLQIKKDIDLWSYELFRINRTHKIYPRMIPDICYTWHRDLFLAFAYWRKKLKQIEIRSAKSGDMHQNLISEVDQNKSMRQQKKKMSYTF